MPVHFLRLGPPLSFRLMPVGLILTCNTAMLCPDGLGPLRDLLVAQRRNQVGSTCVRATDGLLQRRSAAT